MLLCMDPTGDKFKIEGIKTIEPTFGLPAVWINKDQREEAEIKGIYSSRSYNSYGNSFNRNY